MFKHPSVFIAFFLTISSPFEEGERLPVHVLAYGKDFRYQEPKSNPRNWWPCLPLPSTGQQCTSNPPSYTFLASAKWEQHWMLLFMWANDRAKRLVHGVGNKDLGCPFFFPAPLLSACLSLRTPKSLSVCLINPCWLSNAFARIHPYPSHSPRFFGKRLLAVLVLSYTT